MSLIKQNSQKGVSLLLAVFISSLLLALSLGISAILISQIKMIKGMGDSVIAFYAADTGIEQALYNLYERSLIEDIPYTEITLSDGKKMSYKVSVNEKGEGGCEALNFCIESTGTYNKVKRAIEANY